MEITTTSTMADVTALWQLSLDGKIYIRTQAMLRANRNEMTQHDPLLYEQEHVYSINSSLYVYYNGHLIEVAEEYFMEAKYEKEISKDNGIS